MMEKRVGGSSLTFPITLVEGDNGQLGIDVYNYLYEKYDWNDNFMQSFDETIIIQNGSLESKNGNIIYSGALLEYARDDYGYDYTFPIILSFDTIGVSADYYILGSNGHIGPYDD